MSTSRIHLTLGWNALFLQLYFCWYQPFSPILRVLSWVGKSCTASVRLCPKWKKNIVFYILFNTLRDLSKWLGDEVECREVKITALVFAGDAVIFTETLGLMNFRICTVPLISHYMWLCMMDNFTLLTIYSIFGGSKKYFPWVKRMLRITISMIPRFEDVFTCAGWQISNSSMPWLSSVLSF